MLSVLRLLVHPLLAGTSHLVGTHTIQVLVLWLPPGLKLMAIPRTTQIFQTSSNAGQARQHLEARQHLGRYMGTHLKNRQANPPKRLMLGPLPLLGLLGPLLPLGLLLPLRM